MSLFIFCVSRHPTFVFHRFPIKRETEELTAAVEATKYLGPAIIGTCTIALVLVIFIAAVAVGVVVVVGCKRKKVTLVDRSIGPFMRQLFYGQRSKLYFAYGRPAVVIVVIILFWLLLLVIEKQLEIIIS